MTGYYLANYLQRENGLFEYYFPDGTLRQKGHYHEGARTSVWRTWDENGRLIDSVFFDNGIPKMSTRYYYNLNDILTGYSYNDPENKKKIHISYYEDGTINNQSEFIGKSGQFKRYSPDGKLVEIAVFDDNGIRALHRYFREDGTEISEKTYMKEQQKRLDEMIIKLKASRPEFKGGGFSFAAFVQRSLKLPDNFKNIYHNMESIRFSFTLDEKGRAENLKLISPFDIGLEKAIDNMLRVMPSWDMKGLKSYGPITQTINLRIE